MSNLGSFLNQLHGTYHRSGLLSSDPLEFVHRYSDPWDQEAVGLVSALLAYGRVTQIRASVAEVLRRMEDLGGTPAGFVRAFPEKKRQRLWRAAFASWVHRFNRGGDLEILFLLLAESWKEHGSLGAHFMTHHEREAEHFGPALDGLISDWRSKVQKLKASQPLGNFSYFLTAPADGSCCKRWCMFLRWMGRKDSLDPGLWTEQGGLRKTFPARRFLSAGQLVIPLDTHTGRISSYLGLTSRRTLDWKAALEATASLKAHASLEDPVKYDFALSRLGILDICKRSYHPEICGRCPLEPACRFGGARGRSEEKR